MKAGSLAQLPENAVAHVELNGRPIALCRTGGEVYAVSGVCPHRQGPLGHGALHGRSLVCPWHGWEFDCVTGEHDRDPAIKLETYLVTLRDGEIWIEVP